MQSIPSPPSSPLSSQALSSPSEFRLVDSCSFASAGMPFFLHPSGKYHFLREGYLQASRLASPSVVGLPWPYPACDTGSLSSRH